MTLSDQMVEAAAIARHEHCRRRTPLVVSIGWYDLDPEDQACMLAEAHASLTAALALAEAEGAMLCVVGAEIEGAGPLLVADNDRMRLGMVSARASGWNAHRAATLAGRVWP